MKTSNAVEIYGDPERVYARVWKYAADIQDWPALLPHYRYLRVLERSERHKVADFGASRDGFPCRWRARQELIPEDGRITYRHLRGVTRGMEVEWRIVRRADHVHVVIDHVLNYPVPVLGAWFAHAIVGNLFVSAIAGRTLNCIKAKVEAECALPETKIEAHAIV